MPTYVYKFIDSGKIIEVHQAFTDEPFTTLTDPSSGQVLPVKKVFTPVGVSFKGDGFYKTDSRSKSSPSSTPATTTSGGSESSSNGDSTAPAATPSYAESNSASTTTPVSTPAPAKSVTPASTSATKTD